MVVTMSNEMKFCVAARAFGHVTLGEGLVCAKEIGFEGVEVMAGTESGVRLAELSKEAGVPVCCLACDATYTGAKDDTDDRAALHVKAAIEAALKA